MLRNNIELFNEFCIELVTLHMIVFTEWVDDQEA